MFQLRLKPLVLSFVYTFQKRKSSFLGIRDRDGLGDAGSIEPRDDFTDRFFARRTLGQFRRREWAAEGEMTSARGARSIAKLVFVNGHSPCGCHNSRLGLSSWQVRTIFGPPGARPFCLPKQPVIRAHPSELCFARSEGWLGIAAASARQLAGCPGGQLKVTRRRRFGAVQGWPPDYPLIPLQHGLYCLVSSSGSPVSRKLLRLAKMMGQPPPTAWISLEPGFAI